MSPRMLSLTLMLGVSVLARLGSAETLQPFAEGAARPASLALSPEVPGAAFASVFDLAYGPGGGSTLQVRRYYKTPPPPPRPAPVAPSKPRSLFLLRGGFYDSENVSQESWLAGIKTVTQVGPVFRLGATADWLRRENSTSTNVVTTTDAAGNPLQITTTVAESESNLIPVMAVLEFVLPVPALQPYIGVGGGWEFMYIEAFDYATGRGYADHYDGPGWQVYGGADLMISRSIRLNGELFHNESTVESSVFDPLTGLAYEREVQVDGTGGRFGLSFAF